LFKRHNFQVKAQAEIEQSAAIQNLLASKQSDEGTYLYTHAHIHIQLVYIICMHIFTGNLSVKDTDTINLIQHCFCLELR